MGMSTSQLDRSKRDHGTCAERPEQNTKTKKHKQNHQSYKKKPKKKNQELTYQLMSSGNIAERLAPTGLISCFRDAEVHWEWVSRN